MVEAVYLCAAGVVLYAYVGYWGLLRVLSRKQPVTSRMHFPTVSVIIAARNEAANLPAKLANLRALDYPQELLEIIVVSDGSTDGTGAVLQGEPGVQPILLERSSGKAVALNHAVAAATGELLLLLDVRQRLDGDVLQRLVPPFADATVGAVSGELILETADGEPSAEALGIYWKIEKSIRRLESESGSVVGVTGAIYLMRRALFQPLPPGLILDDVLVPMQVVRQGRRVLFQPAAVARDRIFVEPGKEFGRKVRTLTGNLQLLRLAPWLLGPGNPLLFRLISHKLLRLVVPYLLLLMLAAAAVSGRGWMHALLACQVLFFGLAGVGSLLPGSRHWRAVAIPYTFTMLNVAAAVALYKFVTRKAVWG